MRNLLTYSLSVILLLSGVSTSYAQSLQPIPYENSGWTYVGWYIDTNTMLPVEEDVYNCYFDGDTSINAKVYHKFYFDGIHYWGLSPYSIGDHVYIGGMRNEGEFYYFLAKDSISEVLIYDLSKTDIGDTLPLGYYNHLEYLAIEDTSTQIMEDGTSRLVLDITHEWIPPYVGSLIEGIGYILNGLIPHNLFTINNCNGGHELHNYCQNGVVIWHSIAIFGPALNCGYTVGVEQNNLYINGLKAYPNPFTTSTTIEYDLTEPSHVQLTIYNAMGEVIHVAENRMMPQGSHKVTWSPRHLPEGLYYAVLKSEEGVSIVKLIKI